MAFLNMGQQCSEVTMHWLRTGCISSLSPQGAVFVDVQDKSHLKVTAQGGAAEVRNPAGLLVARLEPGKALSFAVQVSQQDSTPTPPQQNPTPTAGGQAHPQQARNLHCMAFWQGPSGAIWALSAHRYGDERNLRTPGGGAR